LQQPGWKGQGKEKKLRERFRDEVEYNGNKKIRAGNGQRQWGVEEDCIVRRRPQRECSA